MRDEILAATGGKMLCEGKQKIFSAVVTDSSKVKEGSVFVALIGERLDGHRYVGEAIRRGAQCVLVQRKLRRATLSNVTVVQVKDTLRALGDLAQFQRRKLAPAVFAITGSNGKTTTKEMLASILEESFRGGQPLRGRVLKTEGNFNNLIGLPLTLLRLRKQDRVAVVELGTNRPGEIERLAEIAEPDMAMITSVAAAHLQGLDSLAGVAHEKGALFRQTRSGGTIAINSDDPWVRRLGAKFKGDKITYGSHGRVRAESAQPLNAKGSGFTLRIDHKRCTVRLSLLGGHNIANAVGAAALAHGFGVSLAAIRRGLEKMKPFPMRMEVGSWRGIGVINDTYNANPASMEAALKTLSEIQGRGEKIAVLGDMFELGRQSKQQHRRLGVKISRLGLHRLYLLGKQAPEIKKGSVQGGMPEASIVIGNSHRDIARQMRVHLRPGDWILLKGSRGMKMETVLRELKSSRV